MIPVTNFWLCFWWRGAPFTLSSELIHRNTGLAVRGDDAQACQKAAVRRDRRRTRKCKQWEGRMTVAQQAYLLTAEIFVLSFAAIFVLWFADRLRRNFFGKP